MRPRSVALTLVLALLLALLGYAPSSASGPCEPTQRPLTGNDDVVPWDLNRHGQVAGQISGGGPPALWQRDGSLEIFWDFPLGDTSVRALNERGDMVGTGTYDSKVYHSWLFTESQAIIILRPTRPGLRTSVWDVNRDRVTVGEQAGMPVVWRLPHAKAAELSVPRRTSAGQARDVTANGAIWGWIEVPSGSYHVKWSPKGALLHRERVPDGFLQDAWLSDYSGRYVSGIVGTFQEPQPAILGPQGLTLIEFPSEIRQGNSYAVTRAGYSVGSVSLSDGMSGGFVAAPDGQAVLLAETWSVTSVISAGSLTGIIHSPGGPAIRSCLLAEIG